MANNIDLIGIQSNKAGKSETEIIKRFIDARAQSQRNSCIFLCRHKNLDLVDL